MCCCYACLVIRDAARTQSRVWQYSEPTVVSGRRAPAAMRLLRPPDRHWLHRGQQKWQPEPDLVLEEPLLRALHLLCGLLLVRATCSPPVCCNSLGRAAAGSSNALSAAVSSASSGAGDSRELSVLRNENRRCCQPTRRSLTDRCESGWQLNSRRRNCRSQPHGTVAHSDRALMTEP